MDIKCIHACITTHRSNYDPPWLDPIFGHCHTETGGFSLLVTSWCQIYQAQNNKRVHIIYVYIYIYTYVYIYIYIYSMWRSECMYMYVYEHVYEHVYVLYVHLQIKANTSRCAMSHWSQSTSSNQNTRFSLAIRGVASCLWRLLRVTSYKKISTAESTLGREWCLHRRGMHRLGTQTMGNTSGWLMLHWLKFDSLRSKKHSPMITHVDLPCRFIYIEVPELRFDPTTFRSRRPAVSFAMRLEAWNSCHQLLREFPELASATRDWNATGVIYGTRLTFFIYGLYGLYKCKFIQMEQEVLKSFGEFTFQMAQCSILKHG